MAMPPPILTFAQILRSSPNHLVLLGYQTHLTTTQPTLQPDPAIQQTLSPTDWAPLIHAIQSHTALGISDGSYMPQWYPG